HVPEAALRVRAPAPAGARCSLSGDAQPRAAIRRVDDRHRRAAVRTLPGRARRGAGIVAFGGAAGAGDRGAQLRARADRLDRRAAGASAESHWRAQLPLGDLARFLRAAGDWPARPAISTVTKRGQTIVLSGHGVVRRLDPDTFDADVNAWSHCLEPARYPGTA